MNNQKAQREESQSLRPSDRKEESEIPFIDYPYSTAPLEPIINQPRVYQNDPESGAAPGKASDNNLPGLEYLNFVDHLLVAPIYGSITLRRKYRVMDDSDQDIYGAIRGLRPLKLLFELNDNSGNQIIQMRPVASCTCCGLPCTADTVDVISSSETLLGSIKRDWSFLTLHFLILNPNGEIILRVRRIRPRGCGYEFFKIMSLDGLVQLGEITREVGGCCTVNVKYKVTFPSNMDIPTKAVLVALSVWIVQMSTK